MSQLPPFVSYKDFDVSKLSTPGPQRKSIPNSSQVYYEIPIQYNYATDDTELIGDLKIEYPKVTNNFGIKEFAGEGGKQSAFMLSASLLPDGESAVLRKMLEDLYKGCAQLIGIHKDNLSSAFKKFKPESKESCEALFKELIYVPTQAGRAPSASNKLRAYNGEVKTLFTRYYKDENTGKPVEEPVPWRLLVNADIKYIPVVHYKKIYVGSKASIQSEMTSAIIVSVKPRHTESSQKETAQALLDDPDYDPNQLNNNLAKLQLQRQNQLLKEPLPSVVAPTVGSTSSISSHTVTSSTADFLANSPNVPSPPSTPVVPTPAVTAPPPTVSGIKIPGIKRT